MHYGKKENSLSLLSDGVHDRVDVYASIAVLFGIFLMPYWIYTDSILALLIGVYIIKESFELGKEATDSLLDVSAGKEIEDKIKKIARNSKIEISELKTQKKGSIVTANLDIKLDSKITIDKATNISKKLKRELMNSIEPLEYVVVQIKSHDITSSSFEPKGIDSKLSFGSSFGWQKKGRFKEGIKEAKGKGPEGLCICKNCGYKQKHKKGIPCSMVKCPKCGKELERK